LIKYIYFTEDGEDGNPWDKKEKKGQKKGSGVENIPSTYGIIIPLKYKRTHYA